MTGVFLSLRRVFPNRYPLDHDIERYIAEEQRLGRMLDYAVIVPRLQQLYEWSAEELAEPRLLELIRDGNPIYAWPFEKRHVWRSPRMPFAARALALVTGPPRQTSGVRAGCPPRANLPASTGASAKLPLSTKLFNPLVKSAAAAGIPTPTVVILETAGRKSGLPRRNPVGNPIRWRHPVGSRRARQEGVVRQEHRGEPARASKARAALAHRHGANAPRRRPSGASAADLNKLNSAVVRAMGSELLTVRIDLDPR